MHILVKFLVISANLHCVSTSYSQSTPQKLLKPKLTITQARKYAREQSYVR